MSPRGTFGPKLLAALALGLALPLALSSTRATAAEDAPRYTMTPSADGFVRLDTMTGAVSLCSKKDGDWACRALADDQRSLQERITKLEQEKRDLEEENRRLEDVLGLNGKQAPGASGPPGGSSPGKIPLPTEKDVDKAFDYVEGMLRKFRERLKQLDDPAPSEGPDGPYRAPPSAPPAPEAPGSDPKANGTRGT